MLSDPPHPSPLLLKHYFLATLTSWYEKKMSMGTGEMMMRRNPK
jgi:hypothetical protein